MFVYISPPVATVWLAAASSLVVSRALSDHRKIFDTQAQVIYVLHVMLPAAGEIYSPLNLPLGQISGCPGSHNIV